ncbi:MAG TPA: STAS domain-containing protein [Candidatus Dormibacteraeota bacterium]|jgi:anti-sigma B factor antagonist|nr:STAS domain-containing protein [Candidatus Dormibacteraeota bacterium]
MSVAVKIEEIDGVSIVELNGRIVLGEESGALRETVKNLVAAGKQKIVLDMSNVTYIDSAGLGILVAAHVSAKKQGASISLCALGQKFREVLQLTRLLTIFDVYDTRTAAVDSFLQKAASKAAAGNQ